MTVEKSDSFVGVPDGYERLWNAHRMAYVQDHSQPGADNCPFCEAVKLSDEEALIIARGETAFVILNLYPYNSGHLLICTYRHVSLYDDLTEEEFKEVAELTQKAMRVLRNSLNCHGFNIGMNQGAVAGAGVAAHLHQHIVPRWSQDANFFPIIGQTKSLPQMLGDTHKQLVDAWHQQE